MADYLRDIDDGEETLLNTKRWKHASFFNRVKRQVAQTWDPSGVYSLRDPTGQIYGIKSRYTVLQVSLDRQGDVQKIVVARASGVDFLDDEAIRAFREVKRFPHPPAALVDEKSATITFLFGFRFEISKSPTIRVYRYGE